jgi:hypothetical protein
VAGKKRDDAKPKPYNPLQARQGYPLNHRASIPPTKRQNRGAIEPTQEGQHYRYVNQVALRSGGDALNVNWCEVRVVWESSGGQLYFNQFVTNHLSDDPSVVHVVASAVSTGKSRTRVIMYSKTRPTIWNTLSAMASSFSHRLDLPQSSDYSAPHHP